MLASIRNYRLFVERATEWGFYPCVARSLANQDEIEFACFKFGGIIVGFERRYAERWI